MVPIYYYDKILDLSHMHDIFQFEKNYYILFMIFVMWFLSPRDLLAYIICLDINKNRLAKWPQVWCTLLKYIEFTLNFSYGTLSLVALFIKLNKCFHIDWDSDHSDSRWTIFCCGKCSMYIRPCSAHLCGSRMLCPTGI